MKIQDVLFFIILLILLWKRDPRFSITLGVVSLLLAIPLFATWTFFTAERLTWYAAAFFFLATILHFISRDRKR